MLRERPSTVEVFTDSYEILTTLVVGSMKNASLGGRPLKRTSCIDVLPHLRENYQSTATWAGAVPYFRNPVSRIFVRMTSTTGAVVLGLVEGAASIQSRLNLLWWEARS